MDVYQNGEWNLEILSFTISEEIKAIIRGHKPTGEATKEDTIGWRLTPNGMFSINTAYRHIKASNDTQVLEPNERYKWIWNAKPLTKSKPSFGLCITRDCPPTML
ncbi:hypothetical protein MTR67_050926 [Solanum verrucosum]|uniref:Uncharacterized protein n=1 Tax=Solanum verrucosum TaxID=315347 RepID=A0AAF0ZZN2_SOLVR|nr:hypothetical protein MTR67_050926 [Solanum verrucosum]